MHFLLCQHRLLKILMGVALNSAFNIHAMDCTFFLHSAIMKCGMALGDLVHKGIVREPIVQEADDE